MFSFTKKKCTQQTVGTLLKRKRSTNTWHLIVEYHVDGRRYICREQMKFQIQKTYKIRCLPVGFQAVSALQNAEVGSDIRVMYNPKKPYKSYLPDNEGLPLA